MFIFNEALKTGHNTEEWKGEQVGDEKMQQEETKQELVLPHKGGGAVPLSLRSRALSSVSMRGNSSLLGHLWKKKHQTGT